MPAQTIKLVFLYVVLLASIGLLFYGVKQTASTVAYSIAGGYDTLPPYPSSCYGMGGGPCTQEEELKWAQYELQNAQFSKRQQAGTVAMAYAEGISEIILGLIAFGSSLVLIRKNS